MVHGLSLVEGGDTGEDLALEQLEGGATAGGDVGHLVSEACHLDSGHGVTTTDDGDRVGHFSEGVGDGEGALGEGLHLEHAHGAVPHHRLTGLELGLERLDGVGPNVETHPAVGNLVGSADLRVGISGELVSQHNVRGQEQLHALGLSLNHERLGELDLVLLHQGGADREALRLVEGEDHAATEDEHVDGLQEGLDDSDLGGHLGPAHDRAEGALGLQHGALQVVQLLLEEEAGHGRLQELGHALGGGVRAVGGPEGVVDVEVRVGRELLGEVCAVLLLLGVEAHVLQEQHGAVLHARDGLLHVRADTVVDLDDIAREVLLEASHDGGQAELLGHALGAAQVGGDQDLGAVVDEVLDGRDGTTDAGVVGDVLGLVHGHVEVATHEHALALELSLTEIADRLLLGLHLNNADRLRLRGRAGSEDGVHGRTLAGSEACRGLGRHAGGLGGGHSGDLGGPGGLRGRGPGHSGAESDGGGSHF
mmetsp:Transcript_13005/g.22029  ORF Transcript_13005/g.22029 Transcript_13005/m.22029 type:complete len:479 (+) Transcript_13005:86-1522(+)